MYSRNSGKDAPPTSERQENSKGLISAAIYVSDYGLGKQAIEEKEGPLLVPLGNLSKKNGHAFAALSDEPQGHASSRDGNNGEMSQTTVTSVSSRCNDDDDENPEALERFRYYQKCKSRWYYGILEFDDVASAAMIYNELDGTDMEFFVDCVDLRFVPDDLMFPREPASKAYSIAMDYKPPECHASAFRHAKAQCLWDRGNLTRKKLLTKRVTEKELDEADYQEYFDSESLSEHEGSVASEGGGSWELPDEVSRLIQSEGTEIEEDDAKSYSRAIEDVAEESQTGRAKDSKRSALMRKSESNGSHRGALHCGDVGRNNGDVVSGSTDDDSQCSDGTNDEGDFLESDRVLPSKNMLRPSERHDWKKRLVSKCRQLKIEFKPALETGPTDLETNESDCQLPETNGVKTKELTPWEEKRERQRAKKSERKAERRRLQRAAEQKQEQIQKEAEKQRNAFPVIGNFDKTAHNLSNPTYDGEDVAIVSSNEAGNDGHVEVSVKRVRKEMKAALRGLSKRQKLKQLASLTRECQQFTPDLSDSRLSRLVSSGDFNIDVTNPAFQDNDANRVLMRELRRRTRAEC